LIVFGFADSDAVGAEASGGGGGGGGGSFFLPQAASKMIVARAITRPLLCSILDFLDLDAISSFTHILQFNCAPALWRILILTAGRTFAGRKNKLCSINFLNPITETKLTSNSS
jgi:hypothetical protein